MVRAYSVEEESRAVARRHEVADLEPRLVRSSLSAKKINDSAESGCLVTRSPSLKKLSGRFLLRLAASPYSAVIAASLRLSEICRWGIPMIVRISRRCSAWCKGIRVRQGNPDHSDPVEYLSTRSVLLTSCIH
jgi:hypothetical protein